MASMSKLDLIAIALMIAGSINWGLVGLLNFNLVEFLLGWLPYATKVVYTGVGISGVYGLISWVTGRFR